MKSIFFVVIFFISSLINAQEGNKESEEKERKFSFGFSGGLMNQSIDKNGDHLTNQASNMASFRLDYQYDDFAHLKISYDRISTSSFSGLSFNSYKIPLLLGTDLSWIRSLYGGVKNPHIRLIIEIGVYYRGVSDFENSTSINYNTNNVFGYQTAIGLKFELSNSLFAMMSMQSNSDYDDVLEAEGESVSLDGYGFELGFAFRF